MLIKDTNENTWSMVIKLLPWMLAMPYPPLEDLARALDLIQSDALEPIYLSHYKKMSKFHQNLADEVSMSFVLLPFDCPHCELEVWKLE